MATPKSADTILKALQAEGIDVQQYKSWRTNNRNHKGSWGPVYGVVIHHTVSEGDDSSVALCYNGHSALPGPLCHGVGRNDGRIALVGHGRANHAGLGDPDVLAAVKAEKPLPPDNEATSDGNRAFYGLEIVNLGNGEDTYTWKQYVSAVKWATAHCRMHGWTEKSVIGHLEWQPGKIDPYGPVVGPDGKTFAFTMARFRADVKAALALPAGEWNGKEEEDVPLTDAEIEKIAERVWKKDGVLPSPSTSAPDNTHWTADSYIRDVHVRLRKVQSELDAIDTSGIDLDVLAQKVAVLLGPSLADQIADKLAARLAE